MEGKIIKNLDTVTQRDKIQFIIAGGLMIVGVVLLFVGMFVDPTGVIHQSVLIAFGEIATLAAAVLGIDAVYTNALQKIVGNIRGEEREREKGNDQ